LTTVPSMAPRPIGADRPDAAPDTPTPCPANRAAQTITQHHRSVQLGNMPRSLDSDNLIELM